MPAKLNLGLIVVVLAISLFFARAVVTSDDTYWHLAVGRQVAQTKSIPNTDNFIYGPQNKTFNSVEWLSALFTYSLVNTFGQSGLIIQRIILAVLITFILYKTLKLVTQNNLLIYASLFANLFVAGNRFKDRPEIFSYLFLVFVNYCFIYYFLKKKISPFFYVLPLIFLAWPNVHPYTIFGVVIVGFWCTLFAIDTFVFKKNYPHFKTLTLISIVSVLAAVIQYRRFFVFLEAGSLASHGLTEFAPLFSEIARSRGYDFFNQITYYIYFYLIMALLYLLLFVIFAIKHKHEPQKIAPYLFYFALLLLPFKAFRLISLLFPISFPFFLMLLVPYLKENKYTDWSIKIFFVVSVYFVVASALQAKIIGNREYQQLIINQSEKKAVAIVNYLWETEYPDKHIEIIKLDLDTKRVYTSVAWNNYLFWKIPQIKVFADALFYNMADIDYKNQTAIETGGDNWQNLVKNYNIDTFLIPTIYFSFNTPAYTLADWKLAYIDRTALLYARKDIVKNTRFDLSAIHPEKVTSDDLKFKPEDSEKALKVMDELLAFDPKNGFARSQIILSYLKNNDIDNAQKLTDESRQILPHDPNFSLYMVKIQVEKDNCSQAMQYAQEANDKSFGDYIIKLRANDYLKPCGSKI